MFQLPRKTKKAFHDHLTRFNFEELIDVKEIGISYSYSAPRCSYMVVWVIRETSRVQCPEFNVQSPESSVQRPDSSVQSAASRVQRSESSGQSPVSSVQSPESRVQRPESSVQLLRPGSRNSGMPSYISKSFYTFSQIKRRKQIKRRNYYA